MAAPVAQSPVAQSPVAQVLVASAPVASETAKKIKVFPATWHDLVAIWRHHRPLQAGKLEDAHPHVYSPELISLTVLESSFARCLLNPDEQARLKQSFSDLFGFQGRIVIEKAQPQTNSTAIADTTAAASPPESLAQKSERETLQRHDALRQAAVNHQTTRDVLEVFGGKVENVRIKNID